ncbi:exonuclease domain-containing protein [Mycolicibacterium fortuitum]|uniref:exonuclease domain-containing protein n=1 Tax=Mycolicibacterium fortuitum TaxID=1766 RepID=UPI001CE1890D|nr:exonuclease domain-containing protein [Mycolicibacterium fortuitum]MCA4727480.1 hypothetical protein [Mycolicibacterium fortuitum]
MPENMAISYGYPATPIEDATFVIVDLETTGDNLAVDAITEIGAVKIRNRQVLAEMSTLVDPQRPIPAEITTLTGITEGMVAHAHPIGAVLPTFLHFAGNAILVAHNADFDLGFLTAAARADEITWPDPPSLCTVRLARQLFTREQAPSMALHELTKTLGLTHRPAHRALADARTTAELFNTLTERAATLGLTTPAALHEYSTAPHARDTIQPSQPLQKRWTLPTVVDPSGQPICRSANTEKTRTS